MKGSFLCVAFAMSICAVAATDSSEYRTWTNVDGRTVEAKFTGYSKGDVAIQTPAGKTYNIAVDSLSQGDQEVAATMAYTEWVEKDHRDRMERLKARRVAGIAELKALSKKCKSDIDRLKKTVRKPQQEYKKHGGRKSYVKIRDEAKRKIKLISERKSLFENMLADLPSFTEPPKSRPDLIIFWHKGQVGVKAGQFGHPLRVFEVLQVTNKGVMHGWFCAGENRSNRFIVVGETVQDVAVGSKVSFERPLEVAGTHTYPTAVGGSNTVFVLRVMPVDVEVIPPRSSNREAQSYGVPSIPRGLKEWPQ